MGETLPGVHHWTSHDEELVMPVSCSWNAGELLMGLRRDGVRLEPLSEGRLR